jgi:hypothetical protein
MTDEQDTGEFDTVVRPPVPNLSDSPRRRLRISSRPWLAPEDRFFLFILKLGLVLTVFTVDAIVLLALKRALLGE